MFVCLHKNLLWLSYWKRSGCNHHSPWGGRQTLMALLKLEQSHLPILGHWKVTKTVIKGQRGQKTTGNLLPCTTSHSSAPADSFALSGPFLLHSFSQPEVFLLGCPVTHLVAGILTSVFCPETGYFTVLSGAFILQHVWILL